MPVYKFKAQSSRRYHHVYGKGESVAEALHDVLRNTTFHVVGSDGKDRNQFKMVNPDYKLVGPLSGNWQYVAQGRTDDGLPVTIQLNLEGEAPYLSEVQDVDSSAFEGVSDAKVFEPGTYEVAVTFRGVENVLIRLDKPTTAEDMAETAKTMWMNDEAVTLGNEWQDIEKLTVNPVPVNALNQVPATATPEEDQPEEDQPEEDQPKEEQPEEEQPEEEQPKEEQPKEEQPKEEQPKEEQPKEEQPKEEQPKEEQPKEEDPEEEQPEEEEPKEDSSTTA